MMAIGNVTGSNYGMDAGVGRNMQEDSVSKGIQKQIENAQKKLQDLSSNEKMTPEDKMKKRQEIQQEITSLNQQLRQHQIETRKKRQSQGASMEELTGSKKADTAKSGSKPGVMSQASMQAMISADVSMKRAQVQGSVATQMEGRAGILESEIKMDASRGASVEKKEEELADVKQSAQQATAGQMSALADANRAMEEAKAADQASKAEKAEADSKTEKAEAGSKANEAKQRGKADKGNVQEKESAPGNEAGSVNIETAAQPMEMPDVASEAQQLAPPVNYVSIDVRL